MNTVDDNDDVVTVELLEQLSQTAVSAETLYKSFVNKIVGEGGEAAEDAANELLTQMAKLMHMDGQDTTMLFLALSKLNCLLLTSLMDSCNAKDLPMTFAGCNMFMHRLNHSVYEACKSIAEKDSHVH